ncbi:MAG TPA: phosphoribosylanthranilate isomerase [Acidobacteriota bacterium]|nr:phosphoribosylanthranilate isomerase [Acidobacteriota bacterium]
MPLRWKVCGITEEAGARAAVDAGADAIGFVFYPPSPRSVSVDRAASIARHLPDETWRFGVFVDPDPIEIAAIVDRVGVDFVQLSGDESPEMPSCLPRHAFKALRLDDQTTGEQAMQLADRYPDCSLLIDAAVAGAYGGTGLQANWSAAAALAQRQRIMLAGGLTPQTVAAAVEQVGPWAVDVSSGVESRPGHKDPQLICAFARALEPFR